MALDLEQIAVQIEEMAHNIHLREKDGIAKLGLALDLLQSPAVEVNNLNRKIQQSKSTWLVPGLIQNIDYSQAVNPCPSDYSVLAADGSHIDADRHYSVHCFLINDGCRR